VSVGTSEAQVTNGSLTGPIANGGVPPGWTILQETPDTMDQNNNVGVVGGSGFAAVPNPTPNGGTWVGMGRDVVFTEVFGQTLSGLTPGQQYNISWYAGNFGYAPSGYINPNAIAARINGAIVGTGATLPVSSNWFSQSVVFTANSAIPSLSFELAAAAKSYMSIDGIAVTPVPEPVTGTLLMAATCAFGASRRRRAHRIVTPAGNS
jgi:hypothetical protein